MCCWLFVSSLEKCLLIICLGLNKSFLSYLLFTFANVCACAQMCHTMHVEPGGQLASLLLPTGPGQGRVGAVLPDLSC